MNTHIPLGFFSAYSITSCVLLCAFLHPIWPPNALERTDKPNLLTQTSHDYHTQTQDGFGWRMMTQLMFRYNHVYENSETQEGLDFMLKQHFNSAFRLMVLVNSFTWCLALAALIVKVCFFGKLSTQESRRLAERFASHLLTKSIVVWAVVDKNAFEISAWYMWFAYIGFLRLFTGLAKDRFNSLVSSPYATGFAYGRNMVLILSLCIICCISILQIFKHKTGLSQILLVLFDPVQLLLDLLNTTIRSITCFIELWSLAEDVRAEEQHYNISQEWYNPILYYTEFCTDISQILLSILHYSQVLSLHGMGFHIVDCIIFMNIRSHFGNLYKKVKTFVDYHTATKNLKKAFPDASMEDIKKYGDVCAICKECMHTAKVLPCGHMFHISCLRSWLEQSEYGNYSCPLCRTSLVNTAIKGEGTSSNFGRDTLTSVMNSLGLTSYFNNLFSWNWSGITANDVNGPERRTSGEDDRTHGWSHNHATMRRRGNRQANEHDLAGTVTGAGAGTAMGININSESQWLVHGYILDRGHGSWFQNRRARNPHDAEMAGWIQIVQSILPHIPTREIVNDLQRTGNVSVTVNNLIGS